MTALSPLVFGSMREHPAAAAFAREVVRVHRRYATEIVAAHRLCPFVRDVDVAFGRFCVALTTEIDLTEACASDERGLTSARATTRVDGLRSRATGARPRPWRSPRRG